MRPHRVDANQPGIVKALREAGVLVWVASHLGDGMPDLICYRRGVGIRLLEVKQPGRERNLTRAQKLTHAQWPIDVVTTADEALRVMGVIRGETQE